MEGGGTEGDREERNKQTVAWNTALNVSGINITCMEATLSIAQRKLQINKLNRHYLTGTAAIEENVNGDIVDDDAWYENSKAVLEKQKIEHRKRMEQMSDKTDKIREATEREIAELDSRITTAKKELINLESQREEGVPYFDPDAIGDIQGIRAKVEEAKAVLRHLERKRQNSALLPMDSAPVRNTKNSPGTLKEVLLSTSPKLPKMNLGAGRRSFFSKNFSSDE